MASYVARSENITRVIQQMNRLAEATGTIEFHPDLIPALTSGENRPLKWFYYCDDRNGITIRLYDEEFRKQHGRIFQTYETYVILRGKNLGTDRDRTKREMRGLFDELLQPPREINTNNPERALEYFQARNTRDTRRPGLRCRDARGSRCGRCDEARGECNRRRGSPGGSRGQGTREQ